LGPASLLLYDVSTLYFETDTGDGFREPGFSKERRLDPQITIGLLTDSSGFPLMVEAFEGNKAETATMIPTHRGIQAGTPAQRCHHRGRRGNGVRGEPDRDRGRRHVVHPQRENR
jgi:transposase